MDLAYKRMSVVNVVFLGVPGQMDWLLVDTGIPGGAGAIVEAAEDRFGPHPPQAILLTHGHFDHTGALAALLEHWPVPVFAHPLELPYLTGEAAYPAADPTVGGGLFSLLAPFFSSGPFDFRPNLQPLPEDGSVPFRPDWRWIHTPGHTPGHVSYWCENDRSLVVGDAFITTRQESIYAIMAQSPEMHGPPQPFTPDWQDSARSVRLLAALEPELVVCGHGRAMRGAGMQEALQKLACEFEQIAFPRSSRYLLDPANVANGKAYVR